MQRFNFSMTPEDGKVARRIGLIVATIYSTVALALTAGVVASTGSKNLASKIVIPAEVQVGHRPPILHD